MSERKRNTSGGDQPISRHPLFPAIVALWCGALFGLVSIAIRPSMIEGVVLTLGIDRVIPMTAPPLGTTTRILIALAATGLGAIVGFVIARRLSRPTAEWPVRQPAPATPKAEKMASVQAEPLAGRRRSLALSEAPARDEPEPAPALAHNPQILSVADLDPADFPAPAPQATMPPSSFEPSDEDNALAETGDPLNNRLFASYSREIKPAATETFSEPQPPFIPAAVNTGNETFTTARKPLTTSAADRIAAADLDDLSPLELLERLGLAMARSREARKRATAAPTPVVMSAPVAPEPAPEFRPEPAPPPASEPAPAPQIEAVEPAPPPFTQPAFTAPLARFTAAPVQPAAAQPEAAVEAEDEVQEAPVAIPRMPAALRPVDLDAFDEDEHDDALPGYIPPRHIGQTPSAGNYAAPPSPMSWHDEDEGETDHDESDEEGTLEEGYSSLLNLSRVTPGRQKAAQYFASEDEQEDGTAPTEEDLLSPTPGERLFDAPTKTDAQQTEKALRDALATLQRMSGAA